MPEKFIVPQFIDKEDQILGPITVRQFLISLITVFIIFIASRILAFPYFLAFGIITLAIGGTFGFMKINGQPFHIFFVNFLTDRDTSSDPRLGQAPDRCRTARLDRGQSRKLRHK